MTDTANDDNPTLTPRDDEASQPLPPTPPSPEEFEGSDIKSSRKREREVSQEPATSKTDELSAEDLKERRIHITKKNRVKLGPTAEEDETPPNSPKKPVVELATSPPHETKVRQISRKVRGLHWEDNSATDTQQESMDAIDALPGSSDTPIGEEKGDRASTEAEGSEPTPESTQEPIAVEEQVQGHADDIQHLAADGMDTSAESDKALKRTSTLESDSDDHENRLKRKLGDRIPSATADAAALSSAEPSKRARDDAEDDNPRERKRPSPPPDQNGNDDSVPKPAPEPEAPTPKVGGFLSYAGVASPFARAKGPVIFGSKSSSFTAASTNTSNIKDSVAGISGPSKPTETFSSAPSTSSVPTPAAPIPKKPTPSGFAAFASSGLSSSPPTGIKRTGFEAFAASSSPFSAANRSKSPTGFLRGSGSSSTLGSGLNRSKSPSRRGGITNAFKSYSHGGSAFGSTSSTPPVKKLRADQDSESDVADEESSKDVFGKESTSTSVFDKASPDGSEEDDDKQSEAVFGNGNGDEDIGVLAEKDAKGDSFTEQQGVTGEEDDETVFQVRGKLYRLTGSSWSERGTGVLKLNVRQSDGAGARLIMRKEAVLSLLLNVSLFKGMHCSSAQDPRYVRFSCFEDELPVHYNIKVANAKLAGDLLEEINTRIPTE